MNVPSFTLPKESVCHIGKAAQKAKAGCPVSKALAGVDEITLDAALD